jgi:hypothetical protein
VRLDARTAGQLAQLISASVHREYPNHIAHLLGGDEDVQPPRALHPIFFGSFDWHSAVHGHWALVRLLRLHPGEPWTRDLRIALDGSFTTAGADGELASLAARPGYEMPYGIAWLLQLDAELGEAQASDSQMSAWRGALAPLVALAAERFLAWIGRLPLPIRSGEHSQTAFAMALALDWARGQRHIALADLVAEQARGFYQADRDAPVAYEPSAHDFFSPALAEADLMRRVLRPAELAPWLAGFLPRLDVFAPAKTIDRADGKLVHADGLNLSRAWMLRGIASALAPSDAQRAALRAATAHENAGMTGVTSDHYAGAHWLGSFAVYLLSDRGLSRAEPTAILAP